MPVTFQVVGNLADFGNDPRADVRVRANATPSIKVGDVAVHSNEPEEVRTDETGAFTLTLVSLPGVWYHIHTPYSGAIRAVNLAGYIPGADPTTGEAFPDGTVINLVDVVDESPTPGYEAIAYVGGGSGGTGDVTQAELTAEALARAAGDAALDVRVDALESAPGGDGGGVTDHGALTGLADDDHAQYHTDARGDARYYTKTANDALLAGKQPTGDYATNTSLAAGLATKAATSHNHTVADTTGLQAALDGKQASGSYAAATHTHTASQVSDSTTVGRAVLTAADAAAARTAIGAGTGTSSFSGAYADLTGKPSTFTPTTHAHVATTDLTATGTKDATTFLRGDNTWAVPAGGGGGVDPWTYVIATTDTTNSTLVDVNCAGLSLSGLPDGLYEFEARILGTSTAFGTGVRAGMAWPSSAPVAMYMDAVGSGATSSVFVATNSAASPVSSNAAHAIATGALHLAASMSGVFRAATMSGAIQVTVRSETDAVSVSVKADSFLRYRRIAN